MKKSHFAFIAAAISTFSFIGCSSSNTSTNPADQLLDNDIFKQATSAGDLARCKDILDSDLKTSCENVINDLTITNEALSSLDKSKCRKVSNERYKKDCETQIDAKIEAKEADTKRLSIEQSAVNNGDASICDQIADINQRGSCKYNVLANQALAKKDPSICEGIGLKDSIEECKNSVNK